MQEMHEATISSRGRITLPKCVLEELDLVAGDRVRYVILADNEVRIMKVGDIGLMEGFLASEAGGRVVTIEEMNIEQATAEGALE